MPDYGFPPDYEFESTIALELLKKWWDHSQIWVPGRGSGPGGTGLPGDTA